MIPQLCVLVAVVDVIGYNRRLNDAVLRVLRSTCIDNQSTLSEFNEGADREARELSAVNQLTGWRRVQMKVWMVLDHPRSSRTAMVGINTSNVILIQIPDEPTTPLNISMARLGVPDECRPGAYPSAGSSKLL